MDWIVDVLAIILWRIVSLHREWIGYT